VDRSWYSFGCKHAIDKPQGTGSSDDDPTCTQKKRVEKRVERKELKEKNRSEWKK